MTGKVCLFLVVTLLGLASCANWAVLVAGSNTYANYRHQSDVYHAYQILLQNKFNPDNIITLAYDDIAHNIRNPFKGKVFNKPSHKDVGKDVYEGVKIDYTGKHVTPTVFEDVLTGNKAGVQNIGTGRVLESTAEDNVFLYFADHGAPGLIAFPNAYLHADVLLSTFAKMGGKYAKMVFYLEACESGSMFTKLPTNTKIYALSAANPTESSWGYYCSPDDIVQGKHIGSCLGDLFSIVFLENTESIDINAINLTEQFEVIQKLTTKSHVMQWGDLSFQSDKIGQYVSSGSNKQFLNLKRRPLGKQFEFERATGMDSRFINIRTLSQIYARERTAEAYSEMRAEMVSMQRFDDIFWHVQESLNLSGIYDPYRINHECMREVISVF